MNRFLSSIALLALLVGCASASPPSGVERALYYVQTNAITNVFNVVQANTNGLITNTVLVTNIVATYQLEPKAKVTETIATVSSVAGNAGVAWAGIAGTLLIGLLGAWARFRNRDKKLINTLGQNVETLREVIKAQPGGAALDAKAKAEIAAQQVDAGVKAAAAAVATEQVNTVDAKESAARVLKP